MSFFKASYTLLVLCLFDTRRPHVLISLIIIFLYLKQILHIIIFISFVILSSGLIKIQIASINGFRLILCFMTLGLKILLINILICLWLLLLNLIWTNIWIYDLAYFLMLIFLFFLLLHILNFLWMLNLIFILVEVFQNLFCFVSFLLCKLSSSFLFCFCCKIEI